MFAQSSGSYASCAMSTPRNSWVGCDAVERRVAGIEGVMANRPVAVSV